MCLSVGRLASSTSQERKRQFRKRRERRDRTRGLLRDRAKVLTSIKPAKWLKQVQVSGKCRQVASRYRCIAAKSLGGSFVFSSSQRLGMD